MNAVDAVSSAFRQYATFRGRARRSEFWWFQLVSTVLCLAAIGFDATFLGALGDDWAPVNAVVTLVTLVPGLAVTWRRLHDVDRSGWWCLVALIPVYGWIVYLDLLCSDSHPHTNRFGPSPKLEAPQPLRTTAGAAQHG